MPWKTCMWRGKAQVETAAISAAVLAAVLASRGNFAEGIGYPVQYSWASLWLSW